MMNIRPRTSLIAVSLMFLALLGMPMIHSAVAADQSPATATARDVAGSNRPAFTGADGLIVQEAVPIPKDAADDRRRQRNYPEQPPVIPHTIAGYQLDLNVNKCLTCHAREFTGVSQAPMVSVTHFQDRDGQVLGAVSARRYFCLQCHVPQSDVQARVPNMFQDVHGLAGRPAATGGQ